MREEVSQILRGLGLFFAGLLSGPNNALFHTRVDCFSRSKHNQRLFCRWPFRSVDKQDLNLFNLNTVIICSIAVPVPVLVSNFLPGTEPELHQLTDVCTVTLPALLVIHFTCQ